MKINFIITEMTALMLVSFVTCGARTYHCKSWETEVGLLQVRGQSRLLTQQIPGQTGLETKILSKKSQLLRLRQKH